tara:strand:+ start:456 stop:638 length:183 start_codon:yes stop_codon:yes gene_type:complete
MKRKLKRFFKRFSFQTNVVLIMIAYNYADRTMWFGALGMVLEIDCKKRKRKEKKYYNRFR